MIQIKGKTIENIRDSTAMTIITMKRVFKKVIKLFRGEAPL